MTTTLTKSTIPPYDPTNSYTSPRQVPRIKWADGQRIYQKHTQGSLNIYDWATQGTQGWESPRPAPKVKSQAAFDNMQQQRRGSMAELLTGYQDPAVPRKGPRVKREALQNYLKNTGQIDVECFNKKSYESAQNMIRAHSSTSIIPTSTPPPETPRIDMPKPKVFYEGKAIRERAQGSVGPLLTHYGAQPVSARPIPRVKFGGIANRESQQGSEFSKTLHGLPPTGRPVSAASPTPFMKTTLW